MAENCTETEQEQLYLEGEPPPIVQQPTANEIYQRECVFEPGLDYLNSVDEIQVGRKNSMTYNDRIEYVITNLSGQPIYIASEYSNYDERRRMGPTRPILIQIRDMQKNKLIQITRSSGFGGCCCKCCEEHVDILRPRGELFGSIDQEWSCLTYTLAVKDEDGNVMFRVSRNTWKEGTCCKDVYFRLYVPDLTTEIGYIIKLWDTGNISTPCYRIKFPTDASLLMKVLIIGTFFLIHFNYFEAVE